MSNMIPKIIGAGAVAILTIDAVKAGLERGKSRTREYMGAELADIYVSQQTAPINSPLYEKIRHWVGLTALDAKLMPALQGIKNGLVCSGEEILKYSVPLLVAGGAFCLPPPLNLLCVGALGIGAAAMVLNMGYGMFPRSKSE